MSTLTPEVKQYIDRKVAASLAPRADLVVMAPSREQAQLRYEELARALQGVEGVKAYAGYRRIDIGGLSIKVKVKAKPEHERDGDPED